MSDLEKKVDAADQESSNMINSLWKRKVENGSSFKGVMALLDLFASLTQPFSAENLKKIIDPDNFKKDFDEPTLLAELAVVNDIVQAYARIIEGQRESPYIIEFYTIEGFQNFFELYHWLRAVTPILDDLPEKRI